MYKFNFKANDFSLRFKLVGRISQLEESDSGIGKSYVFNKLKRCTRNPEFREELSNVVFVSDINDADILKNVNMQTQVGKLYIVDNVEALIEDEKFKRILELLAYNNYVLVIGRGRLGLGVSSSDIMRLHYLEDNQWEITCRRAFINTQRGNLE